LRSSCSLPHLGKEFGLRYVASKFKNGTDPHQRRRTLKCTVDKSLPCFTTKQICERCFSPSKY